MLSARLLVQPSCGQVKIVQYIYIRLFVFPCGYVRILLPIAICTVIFVTSHPDLQVKVSFPDPTRPTWAHLECDSTCALAGTYIWTRRGQSVGQRVRPYSDYIKSEDIFSCAVEGYEHLPSPRVCKSTPQCTDIMPGSEITPFF